MLRDTLIQLSGIDPRVMQGSRAAAIGELERLVASIDALLEYRSMYQDDSLEVRLNACQALLYELQSETHERSGLRSDAAERLRELQSVRQALLRLRPYLGSLQEAQAAS